MEFLKIIIKQIQIPYNEIYNSKACLSVNLSKLCYFQTPKSKTLSFSTITYYLISQLTTYELAELKSK